MNLDLKQLFNFKASSDSLKKMLDSYDTEIKEEENTLRTMKEIK